VTDRQHIQTKDFGGKKVLAWLRAAAGKISPQEKVQERPSDWMTIYFITVTKDGAV
jgi:hypothetical protein